MALKRYEKYPNRWSPATPEQPQGAFKNRTTSVSKDGSFIEKDWANDWSGFFGAALGKAGIVPNGEVDTALSSQYYEAFRTFFYNPENKPDPVDIGAADRSHGHQIANVNGLQSALDSKSANGHKHAIADVTSLQANLDSKVNKGGDTMTGVLGVKTIDLLNDTFVRAGNKGELVLRCEKPFVYDNTAYRRIYHEGYKPFAADVGAYTKAECDARIIGIGQQWQDVTSSRKMNTSYTNTTNKPILISITTKQTQTANGFYLYCDNVKIAFNGQGGTGTHQRQATITAIIPAGSVYKTEIAPNAEGQILIWAELR